MTVVEAEDTDEASVFKEENRDGTEYFPPARAAVDDINRRVVVSTSLRSTVFFVFALMSDDIASFLVLSVEDAFNSLKVKGRMYVAGLVNPCIPLMMRSMINEFINISCVCYFYCSSTRIRICFDIAF